MYEYELMNKTTNEMIIIRGRNWEHALRRNPHINAREWTCVYHEYVD